MQSQPIPTALGVTAVMALVLANAFFVAAEFALVGARKTRLDELAKAGDRKARLARRAIQSLDRYISATQLGITLASLGLGWVGEPALARLIQGGQTRLEAVDDLVGSPTYALDLLLGIHRLMQTGAYGVYHLANAGSCTRYACALAIRDTLERPDVEIAPVSSDRFPLPAPRRSEALGSVKLEPLGLAMRPWREALREYLLTELAAVGP